MCIHTLEMIYKDGRWVDHLIQWLLLLAIPLGVVGETIVIVCILMVYKWKNVFSAIGMASLLLLHLVPGILLYNYPYEKGFQQVALLSLYYIGYSTFYSGCVKNTREIWIKYLKVCRVFAIIAAIQFGIYYEMLGNGIRLHSYFEEPASYAAFLTPFVVYYLLFCNSWRRLSVWPIFVICTYILTMTAIAFVMLVLMLLYRFYHSKYRYISLFIVGIPLFFLLSMIARSRSTYNDQHDLFGQAVAKVVETGTALENLTPRNFEKFNFSTYSTTSNLWVAENAPLRFIGTGIGSHPTSYSRLYHSNFQMYGLNKDDAYSMFIRVYSEFGVIGILVLLLFLVRLYNSTNKINSAVFFLLIVNIIKGGHYTLNGSFLFIFLYYLTSGKRKIIISDISRWKTRLLLSRR